MAGFTRSVRMWDVVIEAHHVPPRYDIPETRLQVGGPSRQHVIARAVRWVASDAGVPPWKPALRIVAQHTRATVHVEEVPM